MLAKNVVDIGSRDSVLNRFMENFVYCGFLKILFIRIPSISDLEQCKNVALSATRELSINGQPNQACKYWVGEEHEELIVNGVGQITSSVDNDKNVGLRPYMEIELCR